MSLAAVLVFDLDDTLYLERDYVRSGFTAADAWLKSEHGISGLGDTCNALFATGQRARIFDDALNRIAPSRHAELRDHLIDIYRNHHPAIELAPDARHYLSARDRALPCALITDGLSSTQQSKITALNLEPLIDYRICTGMLGENRGKPHPLGFEMVEAWAQGMGLPFVYVADNPAKDFVTPRARGWLTIQIMRPERVHRLAPPTPAYRAHTCLDDLSDIDAVLGRLMARRWEEHAFEQSASDAGLSSTPLPSRRSIR